MPVPATAPRFAAAILVALCLAWSSAPTLAQDTPGGSSAYDNYEGYLNYQRARISARSHPDPDQRQAADEYAASLADRFGALDPAPLRGALEPSSAARERLLRLLAERQAALAKQLLDSEARLLLLTKQHDGAAVGSGPKLDEGAVATLEQKITWLRENADFLEAETTALTGKPSAAERAAQLYMAAVSLEEAKIRTANPTNPQSQLLEQAKVEVLTRRVGSDTLENARAKLPQLQRTRAALQLGTRLKPIPARLDALANSHPQERQCLAALQQFYLAEQAALRTPLPGE